MKTRILRLSALALMAALISGFVVTSAFAQDDTTAEPNTETTPENESGPGDVADADSDNDTDADTDGDSDSTGDDSTDSPLPENKTPGKLKVLLSGTGTANSSTALQVTPAIFDAGLVEIGESKSEVITITHAGGADAEAIEINEADLFGINPNEYTVDFNGYTTLFPGDEIPVEVTFTPAAPGKKSAGLRLSVQDVDAPVVLTFRGESRYPYTSDLLTTVESLNFGSPEVNKGSTKTLKLTVDGEPEAPFINITSLSITGQNAKDFTSNFTQTAVKPGDSLSIKFTMKSGELGIKEADVLIKHDGNNDDIKLSLEGNVKKPGTIDITFTTSKLKGAALTRGTSAQFGPDGKLYATEMNGAIKIYTVKRNGKNNYSATLDSTITAVAKTPNHNDDGTPANLGDERLVTGIYVTGSAQAPVIYVASSDPRQAAGPSGKDSGLDTNSGILHRLNKVGGQWVKKDLVRGLPRSEENHVPNGIIIKGTKLYIVTGGHTNQGAPSNNFAFTPEYALSAAVLEIDLAAIGNNTYDLPTLDDEDRPGVNDANDPFGGNDGKNQAKLIPNSPVKIYATGYRNAYDIVNASNGKMYTFDNGPNPPWGGAPIGNCTNQVAEGGKFHPDQLHVVSKNSYGGHANPTRGNKNNTFNASNPQSPIEGPAWPGDCDYKAGGQGDGSLTTIFGSTNGMDEYTASNFYGEMKGNLVVSSFNKMITRFKLTNNGLGVAGKQVMLNNFGTAPLDITAQGDDDIFPGTMWIIDNISPDIMVMEPTDY